MSKIKIDLQKELQSKGVYPQTGTWYGYPYATVERLNPPISPKENLIRYYRGEEYEWLPDMNSDAFGITPQCNLDADASDFTGGLDAFGVKWIPVVNNNELPAFVEPGHNMLEDIADWEDLQWPDVDSWEWARDAAEYNKVHADDDRMRRGIILSGYFERLISLMSFEEAAMALLTDPESVTAFFDKLTELNIQIMDHYIDDFGCGAILIHDDWSAQRSPFFSLQTAMTLLSPQLKKLSDHAHSRNVFLTLHSCGNGTDLVPAMIAGGVDAWQCQGDAVDFDKIYATCGDLIIETYMPVPEDLTGKDLENFIRDTLIYHCQDHKSFVELDGRPEVRKLVYQISRELAATGKMK